MTARRSLLILGAWLVLALPGARAETIVSTPGLSGLGAFEGSIVYHADTPTQATLTIQLTNTTPSALGGYLTAFVFNNPNNQITAASPVSLATNFGLLPFGANSVNGAPFGRFDFGISTGGSFEGRGPPSRGLGLGASGTFTLTLTGTNLDDLSAASFFATLSVPPGAGEGTHAFVARFRGFAQGGGDKVPGALSGGGRGPTPAEISPAPEPGALVLAAVGGAGLAFFACRRRGEQRAERE